MGNVLKKSKLIKSSSKSSSKSSYKSSSKSKLQFANNQKIKIKIKNVINYKINENGLLFNKYKILKTIAHGMIGIVYLVEDENKNRYAYKIEKIGENELVHNYDSTILRQLDFFENICKKYPNHFMNLHDYYITNDCNFDFNYITKNTPNFLHNMILEKRSLQYCIHYFYSLVDITIIDLIKSWSTFNNKMFQDLFLQILNIICILHKNNYIHTDLHSGNIALKKTENKYIIINNKKILTHGYYVQVIDYGLIVHPKYYTKNSSKNKLIRLKYSTDFAKIINFLIMTKYFNFFIKEKNKDLQKKIHENIEFFKTFIPTDNLQIINKKLNLFLKNQVNVNYPKKFLLFLQIPLYKILFYEKVQSSFNKNIVLLNNHISNDDIFYIFQNLYNPDKVLQYFLDKFH